MQGVVKWFDIARGYGFILVEVAPCTYQDVFVHYDNICGTGFKILQEGQEVDFTLAQGVRGNIALEVYARKRQTDGESNNDVS